MGNCNYCISRDKNEEPPNPKEMGSFISLVSAKPNLKDISSFLSITSTKDYDFDRKISKGRSTAASEIQGYPSQLRFSTPDDVRASHTDFVVRAGEHFRQKYQVREPAGHGNFKEVHKVIQLATKNPKAALRHVEPSILVDLYPIMRLISHPHVLKVYEYFEEKKFYEITDFYDGGELFEHIIEQKALDEKTAARLIRQVLLAVNYLHSNSIMHRNICPENLIFEDNQKDSLRLIGFSSATFFSHWRKETELKGSAYYIAPEVIGGYYNEKCDIWSCGVLLYVMLCGYPPFPGTTREEIEAKIRSGKFSFEEAEWTGVSESVKNLIRSLLEFEPEKRITAADALKHAWISDNAKEFTHEQLQKWGESSLKNLLNFQPKKKIQELFWVFFTDNLLVPSQYKHLAEVYFSLDANLDGTLSKEDLLQVMDANIVDEVIKTLDCNNSEAIEYSEFVMASLSRKDHLTTDRINIAFKMLDKDQDGYIGINDLRDTFDPDGQKEIKEDVWTELMLQADVDGDGKVGIKDFNSIMKDIDRD
jgi:calcium-dependent protein kinase